MSDHNTTSDEQKKEELKRITLEAIAKECFDKSSSEHNDLRIISEGLAAGRELELTILTGGLCNYSYKVHFKDERDDDVALFAKMTFGAPLSFPGVSCSLNRTNCEYEMMELYSRVSPFPESTVTPYFCIDVDCEEDNTKILVTQFAPSNLEEQAGHVFIDGGVIDTAFASKLAKGFAALHNAEVTDPDFNKDMKPFFMALAGMLPTMFDGFLGIADELDSNAQAEPESEHELPSSLAAQFAQSKGKEKLDRVCEVYNECLQRTDCYVHGDAHAFNILVEGKSKNLSEIVASLTNETSSSGDFCLIDWEMTHVGPMGKDIGLVTAFPVACLCAHAAQGDTVSAESILEFLDALWSEYSKAIDLEGRDDHLSLVDVYRQVLGFGGLMMQGYSAIGFHMDYLPIEEGPNADAIAATARESLGLLGMKALFWGFGEDGEIATLEELKGWFHDAIKEELQRLVPAVKKVRKSRRSSLLRTTGRRVSDSHVFFKLSEDFGRREPLVRNHGSNFVWFWFPYLGGAAPESRGDASLDPGNGEAHGPHELRLILRNERMNNRQKAHQLFDNTQSNNKNDNHEGSSYQQ
eukprot:CAMPEP_0172366158 /NCGR_PEP_ID=MMETSP1060-20121228/13764_1 /TAXON_ID=37318 /ORGANISM="Pseudo-nitzschia pungens, Strain cf. cingulata" /LENGTH=579 /DNA_ID=CAMNT_0013089887 /DNA_START=170 /DNA_END=1908 /DNA_ORIENTATION=+